jgi:hypothetical protein
MTCFSMICMALMVAASLAAGSQSKEKHICKNGEVHMETDAGKLAQDYPAQSLRARKETR